MVDFRNPNGAVCIADGGVPRILTIKARANISGGYWVNGSSAAGVVGSGAESYAAADIEGYPVASQIGSEVIGLALQDIPSGTYGPIGMRGLFLLPAGSGTVLGSIYPGNPLLAGSMGTVIALGSNTLIDVPGAAAKADQYAIGRAITRADGNQFLAVSVNI